MKIAIIGGSGKMGRWFASYLLKDGKQVIITGRNEKRLLATKEQLGVEVTTSLPSAINGADIVLISVPIDSFEEVVRQLQPHLRPEQVVVDITSVKVLPMETMHRYITRGVVLGIHPMFGPGAKDIADQSFVLTPTNEKETALAERTRQYLEARGARAAVMTPNEHDEMMAVILGLSHFIALVSADTLLSFDTLKQMEAIGGTTFRLLLTLAKGVIAEDPDFYASLQMHLPRMTEIHQLFRKNAEAWAEIVNSQDKQEFVERMNTLKGKLQKSDPEFDKAYENMYKLLEKS